MLALKSQRNVFTVIFALGKESLLVSTDRSSPNCQLCSRNFMKQKRFIRKYLYEHQCCVSGKQETFLRIMSFYHYIKCPFPVQTLFVFSCVYYT